MKKSLICTKNANLICINAQNPAKIYSKFIRRKGRILMWLIIKQENKVASEIKKCCPYGTFHFEIK
jgi:DNA-binding sugar fermentation-stimulating protein